MSTPGLAEVQKANNLEVTGVWDTATTSWYGALSQPQKTQIVNYLARARRDKDKKGSDAPVFVDSSRGNTTRKDWRTARDRGWTGGMTVSMAEQNAAKRELVRQAQRILGVNADGVIGPQTRRALQTVDATTKKRALEQFQRAGYSEYDIVGPNPAVAQLEASRAVDLGKDMAHMNLARYRELMKAWTPYWIAQSTASLPGHKTSAPRLNSRETMPVMVWKMLQDGMHPELCRKVMTIGMGESGGNPLRVEMGMVPYDAYRVVWAVRTFFGKYNVSKKNPDPEQQRLARQEFNAWLRQVGRREYFKIYDSSSLNKAVRDTMQEPGFTYIGRGWIQLTGYEGYRAMQERTGYPLVAKPWLIGYDPDNPTNVKSETSGEAGIAYMKAFMDWKGASASSSFSKVWDLIAGAGRSDKASQLAYRRRAYEGQATAMINQFLGKATA